MIGDTACFKFSRGRRWIFLRDEIEAAVRSRPGDRSAA
jgi:hypothetical protein